MKFVFKPSFQSDFPQLYPNACPCCSEFAPGTKNAKPPVYVEVDIERLIRRNWQISNFLRKPHRSDFPEQRSWENQLLNKLPYCTSCRQHIRLLTKATRKKPSRLEGCLSTILFIFLTWVLGIIAIGHVGYITLGIFVILALVVSGVCLSLWHTARNRKWARIGREQMKPNCCATHQVVSFSASETWEEPSEGTRRILGSNARGRWSGVPTEFRLTAKNQKWVASVQQLNKITFQVDSDEEQ